MDIRTVKVSESNFKLLVTEDLEKNSPKEGEVMIVMLQEKLGSFNDPVEGAEGVGKKSPVFVFGSKEAEKAKEVIGKEIERINSQDYFLPAMTIEYFLAILSKEEFETFVADSSQAPQDNENLLIALKKYKEAISKRKEE